MASVHVPHMNQFCLKNRLYFTVGRQEKAVLWVLVYQIKARQQHDESHPSEAGDLFKGGGGEAGAGEMSVGMQRRGNGEKKGEPADSL